MDRRSVLTAAASMLVGWFLGAPIVRRLVGAPRAEASSQLVRRVAQGDVDQIVAVMKSCVSDGESFHGLCNAIEWTRGWAEEVVNERPRSLVVEQDEVIVAYCDVPSKVPRTFGNERVDHYQQAFWCGAAGVRMDLLGEERAVYVFQQLLFHVVSDAMSLGYEFVRAAAPWEQHPYLPVPFKEYPGLTVEPFVDEKGVTKYLLEWRLAQVIERRALSR